MKNKIYLAFITLILFSISCFAQQKKPDDINRFRQQMANGKLKLVRNHIAFGKVFNTVVKTDSLEFYNNSDKELKIKFDNVPKYLTLKLESKTIKPKQIVKVVATFNASAHKTGDDKQIWGDIRSRINVVVDDDINGSKRNILNFSASIDEDYSKYTKKQLANAPIIEFETTSHDAGKIPQGESVKFDFVFKNTGKNDLEIRHVKAG